METINKEEEVKRQEMQAHTIRKYLKKKEDEVVEQFLTEHEAQLAFYGDEEVIKTIQYIADKCFRIGFKSGSVAMLTAIDIYKKGEMK